ncbi:hypothetical protein STAS_25894 [Striga asiatica]|uniref:SOSEKI DIX-like domain-containing protein n=1 Tax=Striga asiatica TaxID=4170 RepID=A0A5A7QUJ2_STRAF|nr:hypothetical protein STAS_25894 [Striga asiatica]
MSVIPRRLMEAQSCSQVRRLHIVYFLSRNGKIEHPHLVRAHHLSKNGVRLRDVKRWIGELRGMNMPELFSWSYKRRYKTGYVWQDLVDDDLINPISDNEYVLKGSEILSTKIKELFLTDEQLAKTKDQFLQEDSKTTTSKEEHHRGHSSSKTSTKYSSEIEQESPSFSSESSTVTDDSIKADKMEKTLSKSSTHEKKDEKNPSADDKKNRSSLPFYSTFFSKKNKKKTNNVNTGDKMQFSDNSMISLSEPQLSKSKNTSNVFRNLVSCGPLETNDSAVVAINKQNNNDGNNRPTFLNMSSNDLRNVVCGSAKTCKEGPQGELGGSQRILRTPKWTQQQLLSCGRLY